MSRSSDPGHFFQTSDSLATTSRKAAKAKNKHGNPITLPSKILAITTDPLSPSSVYVAEAAGTARKIDLENGTKSQPYTGATAPLTCLAVSSTEPRTLFAGSWTKDLYAWDLSSRKLLRRYAGHTDFVKCLLCTTLSGTEVLISGSADACIIVWNAGTGQKIHTLKGHARGILDLALDPSASTQEEVVLFSADSVRDIRQWRVSLSSAGEVGPVVQVHETSVNKLHFETGETEEADLWTASADKTAQRLVRARGWESDTVLTHPDFVKDVVVDTEAGLVVTACRDEEVRVWDSGSGELKCVFSGHYEEVTGLVLLPPKEGERSKRVVSCSIDGTVRCWNLDPAEIARVREEAERMKAGVVEEEEERKEGVMTAEEEAELAELMGSDDE